MLVKMNLKTIADVKAFNQSKGFHFFDGDTMRFFASRIASELLRNQYFITSEKKCFDNPVRVYSIRKIKKDGDIETISKFGSYTTKNEAKEKIESLKT